MNLLFSSNLRDKMSLGRIAVVALVGFTHASGIVAFGEFLLSYTFFWPLRWSTGIKKRQAFIIIIV